MNNRIFSICLACLIAIFYGSMACAQQPVVADTVKTGIYITSIHNIDFKQNEYEVNMWVWFTYHDPELNFIDNLEIPQAKSFTRSFTTIDSTGGKYYVLMKLQCTMKDSWRINNFPFDRQNLHLSLENSQFDVGSMVFLPDTLGKHFDARFTLRGWDIDSFKITSGIKLYETTFGDTSVAVPHVEYSSYKVNIGISRDSKELFWKMFLGMYVSFLIAYICFYIHADNIDSRFGLSVGALFAAVGNKYIIDSSLPESTSLTLVDTLHGITLFFIFAVITASGYSLRLHKKNHPNRANRFDFIIANILLGIYIVLNLYYVLRAVNAQD